MIPEMGKPARSVVFMPLTCLRQAWELKREHLEMRTENHAQWHMPVTPVLGKRRLKNQEFKASRVYMRPYLKSTERGMGT